MSGHGLLFSLFLLLFFGLNAVTYALANAVTVTVPEKGAAEMKPAATEAETRVVMVDVNEMINSRRGLSGSFQICALCTCCGGAYCLPSPCCYAINCNIPNRPFGFCAFTPKTCNCFGCSNL